MAMTRLTTTNSKTIAEFTLDGVSVAKVENCSVTNNAAFHASVAGKAHQLGIAYEGLTDTSAAPHAEDKILDMLFDRGDNLASKKTLSIRINKAPCGRCARNLTAAAKKYGLLLRFKAGWISAEGWDGIRVLAENGIGFRYWTEEDRAAKAWTGQTKANFKISAREKAVSEMSRGDVVATTWKQRQTEEIARLQRDHPFWSPNITGSWKSRGMSASAYRNVTLSQAQSMAPIENITMDVTMGGTEEYY
jgi:hypothetical protein